MRGLSSLLSVCVGLGALVATGCRQPAAAPSAPPPPKAIINPFLGPTTLPPPAMPPSVTNPAAASPSFDSGGPSVNGASNPSSRPAAPVDDSNLPGPGGPNDYRTNDDGGWKSASASDAARPTRDLHASVPPLRHGSSIQQALYEEELPAPEVRSAELADSAGDRYLRSRDAGSESLPPAGASDVRLATYQETAPAGSSLAKARGGSGWGPALKKDPSSVSPAGGATLSGGVVSGAKSPASSGAPVVGEPRGFLPPDDAEPLRPAAPAPASVPAASPARLRLP